MAITRMPLAKEVADFAFSDRSISAVLVRDLVKGSFLASQRNVVLISGTEAGKAHLAIAIARACVRGGARARFFNSS